MWGIVESYNNLTPRGLENPLSTSELNLEILDSFLLPNPPQKKCNLSATFEHMIFVWNGKNSNALVKSLALSSAYNLESLVEKGRDKLLHLFFTGGNILKNKQTPSTGNVIQLDSTSHRTNNNELEKEISRMSQTIFLFKFLFPLNSARSVVPTARSGISSVKGEIQSGQISPKKISERKKQGDSSAITSNSTRENLMNSESNQQEASAQPESQRNNEQIENDQQLNQQLDNCALQYDCHRAEQCNQQNNLKMFRKTFCSQNIPSNLFFNNFIRIPPQNKKKLEQQYQPKDGGASNNYKYQEDQIASPNQQKYEIYQDQNQQQMQQQQQQQWRAQDQRSVNLPSAQPKKISMKPLDLASLSTNQTQQIHLPKQQMPKSSQSNLSDQELDSQNNQKGMSGDNDQGEEDNQIEIESNNINNAGYQGEFLCNYQYQNNPLKFQQQEDSTRAQSLDPVVKLNIKFGKVMEDEQEKNQTKYKLNINQTKDNANFLHINVPLENALDNSNNVNANNNNNNYQPNFRYSHRSNNDSVNEGEKQNNSKNWINNNNESDSQYELPPTSHRGGGPQNNLTSISIMNEISRKNKQAAMSSGPTFTINTKALENYNLSDPIQNNYINEEDNQQPIEEDEEVEESFGYNPEDEQNGERLNPIAKIKTFAQICSAVIPNFLYVSGEDVAYNKNKLKKNGITHIINCAADVCKNMFPDDFTYKFYKLKDTKTENIECIFYDTIEFIEQVAQMNGRVFIHCIQGVSRSITLAIAYVIWKEKYDFQEALTFVKKARDVASPNPGFLVQLINFYKRLYQPYDTIMVKPRVWCVSSHQVEQPLNVVAKMLLEGLYQNNKLDPRGVFIVQSTNKLFAWIGSLLPQERQIAYMDCCMKHIDNLRKFEHASNQLEIIQQGEENEEFWQLWFDSVENKPMELYEQNKEWNNWFIELKEGAVNSQVPKYFYEEDENNDKFEEEMKPLLFVFPDHSNPLTIFDYDELIEENLCVLCKQQEDVVKVHIWKGPDFLEQQEVIIFLERLISINFYGEVDILFGAALIWNIFMNNLIKGGLFFEISNNIRKVTSAAPNFLNFIFFVGNALKLQKESY